MTVSLNKTRKSEFDQLKEIRKIIGDMVSVIPEITGFTVKKIDDRTANITLIFFSGVKFSWPTRIPEPDHRSSGNLQLIR